MKRTAIYAIAALLALQGCTALDEMPTTSLSGGQITSSEGGLESMITGCYQGFRSKDMISGRLFAYLQQGSGLVHWAKLANLTVEYQQCLDLTLYSQDTYNQTCFTNTFAGINRCNTVLQSLPDSPVDDAYKLEIEAEAKLLRAVFYYTAVRMWGDLPLVTTPPTSLEDANKPRSSYIDIYKLILEDLTFAEENMRDKARQEEVNGEKNRAFKWAATAWKACVYLQIGCILSSPDDQPFKEYPDFTRCGIADSKAAFTLALQTAEKVIGSGAYSLATSYAQLFRWTEHEDWFLPERIFTIANSTVSGTSSVAYYSLPEYPGGTSDYDQRNSTWGRVRPERWVYHRWAQTYGGTLDVDRSDGLDSVYVDCQDPRFDASYIYGSYYNLYSKKTVSIYPSVGRVKDVDFTSDNLSQPFFKKYLSPDYNGTTSKTDVYYLRYGEIYLCAAEAAAELSESKGDANWTKAMGYIEVLHKRARGELNHEAVQSNLPRWKEDRFDTKEALLTGIFWERVYEMSGECHEWFDMRRRGAQWVVDHISKPLNAFLQLPENNTYFSGSYFGQTLPTDVAQVRRGLLCAFPEKEILDNSAIGLEDQNPYFIK